MEKYKCPQCGLFTVEKNEETGFCLCMSCGYYTEPEYTSIGSIEKKVKLSQLQKDTFKFDGEQCWILYTMVRPFVGFLYPSGNKTSNSIWWEVIELIDKDGIQMYDVTHPIKFKNFKEAFNYFKLK
ncbi:MAG: hypothetical protein M0R17_13280 [Candidatus Omnitrophica bacterium]|jgi:hypothetical protein|nr:hypothetical protein [Candidatus Omnitrophota bacterium]